METYRFTITIPEDRKIQIPDFPGLSEKEVEIIIQSKSPTTIKKGDAKAFMDKWMTERNHSLSVIKCGKSTFGEGTEGSVPRDIFN